MDVFGSVNMQEVHSVEDDPPFLASGLQTKMPETVPQSTAGGSRSPILSVRRWKTDDSVITLADQAVASGTTFLSGMIIARACSKHEFGLYVLAFSIVVLLIDFQTSLVAIPYMIRSPRLSGNELRKYAGRTFIHQLGFSMAASLGLLVVAGVLQLTTAHRTLSPVLASLGCVVVFILLRDWIRRVCFAQLQMKSALVLDCFVCVFQVGGVALLASRGNITAHTAYWVIGAASAAGSFIWLVRDRHTFEMRIDGAYEVFRCNWSIAKWIFASGAVWTVGTNFYPWILNVFHGATAVAVWGVCLGVTATTNPLLLGLQNLLGPRIAHSYAASGYTGVRQYVRRCNAILGCLILPFSCLLVLMGDLFVRMLYSSRYAGNGRVVSILALNLVASVAGFSYSRGLFVIERADLDFKINIGTLAVGLGCGFPLVVYGGPAGAAWALTIGNTTGAIARYLVFQQLTGRSIRDC
jgi:O-antigen/teichoic acid export membrane protein